MKDFTMIQNILKFWLCKKKCLPVKHINFVLLTTQRTIYTETFKNDLMLQLHFRKWNKCSLTIKLKLSLLKWQMLPQAK